MTELPEGGTEPGRRGGQVTERVPALRLRHARAIRRHRADTVIPDLPPLAERLHPPMPRGGWAGWAGPLAIAGVAGVLRFVNLGQPRAFVFDETYYPKDAYALLKFGHEQAYIAADQANQRILDGNLDVFSDHSSYVVHPPLGKWMIAVGEWMFGFDPFGWRFVTALLGTLAVLMVARIGRRLTRSNLLGCVAGLLLAVDGLALVMSRTALLDGILMFWIVAAFGCLLLDRDWIRSRLARMVSQPGWTPGTNPLGPWLLFRPWRLAAGVCLGAGVATKWNALFFVAVFGLLTVLWDMGARRAIAVRWPLRGTLVRDALPAFGAIVGIAVVVYVASWSGWFFTDDGYYRDWAVDRTTSFAFIPDVIRSWWHYHVEAFRFHRDLDDPHVYESHPAGWLVLARPVSFFYTGINAGDPGCDAAGGCSRAVLGIGTPTFWWLGVIAIGYCLWRWAARRDWRAGAVLSGLVAGYLPWFYYAERTIFYFYAIVFVPFTALATSMMLGAIMGPGDAPPRRRGLGIGIAGGLVLLVLLTFYWFWPIYTADQIPTDQWRKRMWFHTWI
ncbi:MAG: phospholipid carrier-dependent glycosyltransferase [Sporichthyaceae bacterium]|nr:phospholipid carrier-dependent glycosyltransferase [Sporichthyaceae bacterium]